MNQTKLKQAIQVSKAQAKTLALMEKSGGQPKIWKETEDEVIYVDHCIETVEETRNLDYEKTKAYCKELGCELMTAEEYEEFQSGSTRYEINSFTWWESGENPSVARYAAWDGSDVSIDVIIPEYYGPYLGARRLLRVKKT